MPDPAMIARFEQLGPDGVRLALSTGSLPTSFNVHALEWLAVKDQEERRLSEASQAEQREIAHSASEAASVAARAATAAERQAVAAEKANTRATIALAIAIVSIIATVIGILVTHYDALNK